MENMRKLHIRHFKNRLFDLDTLLLQVYNVNFLYILKTYSSKHSGLRDELNRIRSLWQEISEECFVLRVTPLELFSSSKESLEEASFNPADYYFDEAKFGIFIRREALIAAAIGHDHRLPREINGHRIDGNIFGDTNPARRNQHQSNLDEYYFLPCTAER